MLTAIRWRLGLAVGAAVAVAAVALEPGPLLRVFPRYAPVVEHLPGRRLDTGDPIYFHFGSNRSSGQVYELDDDLRLAKVR